MNGLTSLILIVATAYASAEDCGGNLKGPNGTVTSPNWPRNYPDNANCFWTITVGEGNTIELEFLDFELERGSPINGCLGRDFVRVVDGEKIYGPYCDTVTPPKIMSKTNKLEITFRSDESLNYRGFQASYKEILKGPVTTTTPAPTTRYPPNINCGSEWVADSGFLTSPKYPENYPNNANCAFYIELEANTTGSITLKFLDFELESSKNCKADSLKVHDGENGYFPVIATLCGKKVIQPITTSGKAVYLHFTTDVANNARGFNISWQRATCEEAGGVCAETCQHGELEGQPDTCNNSSFKCCKRSPAPICGKRFISGGDVPYIINGDEAKPNSWPWQLFLEREAGRYCGAVLLSDEWVVTTARCVYGEDFVTVVAGEHDRLTESGDEVRMETSNIIVHEDFIAATPWPNDIALLKLSKKLTLGPKIFPACFPQKEDMEFGPDDTCYITGWGVTRGTGDESVLNELAVSLLSNDDCELRRGGIILDTNICVADGFGGPCAGDTGGPVVCKKEDTWFLAGVFSFGTPKCRVGVYPSVYTRVAKFKTWIDQKIKANGGY